MAVELGAQPGEALVDRAGQAAVARPQRVADRRRTRRRRRPRRASTASRSVVAERCGASSESSRAAASDRGQRVDVAGRPAAGGAAGRRAAARRRGRRRGARRAARPPRRGGTRRTASRRSAGADRRAAAASPRSRARARPPPRARPRRRATYDQPAAHRLGHPNTYCRGLLSDHARPAVVDPGETVRRAPREVVRGMPATSAATRSTPTRRPPPRLRHLHRPPRLRRVDGDDRGARAAARPPRPRARCSTSAAARARASSPGSSAAGTVVACDPSPAMLARAAAKAPPSSSSWRDARDLGAPRGFDLVTRARRRRQLRPGRRPPGAVRGVREPRPGGLLVFDLNTLRTFRSFFGATSIDRDDACVVEWRGHTPASLQPGGAAEATMATPRPRRRRRAGARASALHREYHHPLDRVARSARRSGPRPLATYGQDFDCNVDAGPGRARHAKLDRDRRGAPRGRTVQRCASP